MQVTYSDKTHGIISEIVSKDIQVPFYENIGPAFYYKENNEQKTITLTEQNGVYTADLNGIRFSLAHIVSDDTLAFKAAIQNNTDREFAPEAIGFKLGINSYMVEYPQWNDKFFPSYLRCEKTHFTGYFMSPLGKLAVVVCDSPVAAWELDYNTVSYGDELECDFGHRIHTGNLLLTVNDALPERHPDNLQGIGAGEEKSWTIQITLLDDMKDFKKTVVEKFGLPMLEFENYTLAKGETAKLSVLCDEEYTVTVTSPSGKAGNSASFPVDEYGVYTATVKTASGKVSQAKVYCRHDYGWYLKAARKNAVYKPQKATTHTESWYGLFSAFLAKKHYPDAVLDALAKANFDEIMPPMYDFENGEAIVIPNRIQNTACLVGLLTDLYEADPENNAIYLDYANNMAEELLARQTEDGAYRNHSTHYTSVIYIAKSILELALCEKKLAETDSKYLERYQRHYASVKAAADDLQRLAERIGTEGEHTLEDGMISCSALQLGYFALTLPEAERAPYIEVAEYLMAVHKCLEEQETPDCRMKGATLRFWEAQYDVMIRGNMMNTPHGWTSWKNYATYYLYLLTGKEEYLKDTINTMGACLQMVDENENLRWAFIKDPYNKVKVWVPDMDASFTDGYESVPKDIEPGHRGKFEEKVFGETYVDMISGWYRAGEQKIMGGYRTCGLWYKDHAVEVDSQGGACDNDVHEHFKCLEETLLKKAFVIVGEEIKGYNCAVAEENGSIAVSLFEECDYIHINTDRPVTIHVNGKAIQTDKGLHMIQL